MHDYIELGSTPYAEECTQLNDPDYYDKTREECKRFIRQLRRQFGNEPTGARLQIKAFQHDFGTYHEVVCWFDDQYPESIEYAFNIEANLPERWDKEEMTA